MKFRSILVLALALVCASPAVAQETRGTSPLSIAKGGTGGATASAARTALGAVGGPGSSTSGHVASFNGTGGGAIQDSGFVAGAGVGGIIDASLPPYNADPTGATSSTTAINNAIAAACPSLNGTVYLPPGTYLVNGGLNMTNITGGHVSGGCRLRGAGQTATVLKTTTATNAVIDLTGSSSIVIEDLWIRAGATAGSGTAYGVLLAASNTLPCNVIMFKNVTMDGWFSQAGFYIYNCSDGLFTQSIVSGSATGAPYDIAITATNPLGATSSYATITTVNPGQSGNWEFDREEIHDLSHPVSGASTVIPLYINGTFSPIVYTGGIVAGSIAKANGGLVTFQGNPTGLVFNGTQFYADNGTQADYVFFQNAGTVTGLVVQGCNMLAATGIFNAVNSGTWSGLNVTGNGPIPAIPMFLPLAGNNGTLTGSIVDAQGAAINLGGVVNHTVMLRPGTITAGSQTNNGSF